MTADQPPLTTTDRTRVRRAPARATDDRAEAYAILDEGRVAHVGFVDQGAPVVIPMAYGRDGDRLLLHAARASRLARTLAGGAPVCVTVTLLDGMVLARSSFHHSMNYRSVAVLGTARPVEGEAEQRAALDVLVDHLVPERSREARAPNRVELRQTMVLALPIEEASVKRRAGGPIDDPEDLGLGVWAGTVPLRLVAGPAEPAPDVAAEARPPAALRVWDLRRPHPPP